MDWQAILQTVVAWATTTGVKIVISLVLLLFSFRIITVVTRKIERRLTARNPALDKTLTTTFFYLIRLVLRILVVVCLVGYLGIDTSGITALVASLGVCVGLAVNGALSNLAGGALLIITRPFRIDDYIEAQGHEGTVEDIHITQTRLRTPDNKIVYIPNGLLSAGTIVNYSEKKLRRIDLVFSVAYTADLERAKALIREQIDAHKKALKDPAPYVRMSEQTDARVSIAARIWVSGDDFWDVRADLLEAVKTALEREGIEIPTDRLEVRISES